MKKVKIAIRNFEARDMERILEFREETAKESFPDLKMNKEEARKAIFRQMKRHPGTVKVAVSEGQPVGFVIFKAKNSSLGSYGRISTIFVEASYRKHGVGALLLKEAEKSLASRGIKHICADITSTNSPSLDFFREHGYRETRTVVEKKV